MIEETPFASDTRRFRSRGRSQLREERRHMMVDGLRRNEEPLRNIGVRQARGDQVQDLDLARRETRRMLPGLAARTPGHAFDPHSPEPAAV